MPNTRYICLCNHSRKVRLAEVIITLTMKFRPLVCILLATSMGVTIKAQSIHNSSLCVPEFWKNSSAFEDAKKVIFVFPLNPPVVLPSEKLRREPTLPFPRLWCWCTGTRYRTSYNGKVDNYFAVSTDAYYAQREINACSKIRTIDLGRQEIRGWYYASAVPLSARTRLDRAFLFGGIQYVSFRIIALDSNTDSSAGKNIALQATQKTQ